MIYVRKRYIVEMIWVKIWICKTYIYNTIVIVYALAIAWSWLLRFDVQQFPSSVYRDVVGVFLEDLLSVLGTCLPPEKNLETQLQNTAAPLI